MRQARNSWEVFNETGQTYNRAWGVFQLVTIAVLAVIFKDFILEAVTKYTVLMAVTCLAGFALLEALGWHWPKPAESYSRELILIVVLDAAFTATLSQHWKYLWVLPFAVNKFAYQLACLFTYRNGQPILAKVKSD